METEKETLSLARRGSVSSLTVLGILASGVVFVGGLVVGRRSRKSTPNHPPVDPVHPNDKADGEGEVGQSEDKISLRGVAEVLVPESQTENFRTSSRSEKVSRLRKAGLFWIQLLTLLGLVYYAGVTRNIWLASQDSVNQGRRQIAMEHRAWLLLDTDYSDTFTASDEVVKIPIRLTNIGKSPAEHMEGTVEVNEVPRDKIAAYSFAPGPSHNAIKAGLIYPGFPHTTEAFEWAAKDKAVKVASIKRTAFVKGDIVFVIQGRITYDDVFHVHHWVEFCHAISANTASHAQRCVDKNRIDSFDE